MSRVFETPWFSIDALPVATGGPPYYVMAGGGGVIILPLTDDGGYLMVRQYRPTRARMSLEFPAGQIDPGETAENAARHELMEETGWTAAEMTPLGRGKLALNRDSGSQTLFLARGLRPIPGACPETGI